jgi:hypothetical protein
MRAKALYQSHGRLCKTMVFEFRVFLLGYRAWEVSTRRRFKLGYDDRESAERAVKNGSGNHLWPG